MRPFWAFVRGHACAYLIKQNRRVMSPASPASRRRPTRRPRYSLSLKERITLAMKATLFRHSPALALALLLFALVLGCVQMTAAAQTLPAGDPPRPLFPFALSLDLDGDGDGPIFPRVSPAVLDGRGNLLGRVNCPPSRLIFSTSAGGGTTATYGATVPEAEQLAPPSCRRLPAPSVSTKIVAPDSGGPAVKEVTVAVP